jgi:hypothetical protein
MRVQLDGDIRCHGNGLVHRAAMRHFQESLSLLGSESMGQMDAEVDATDAMWSFGHGPFRIDAQPLTGNVVSRAKLPDEVGHAAGHRPDEQLDRTHPGILSAVVDRLIRDDSMLTARDVVTCPAMKGSREFHVDQSVTEAVNLSIH